MACFRPLTAYHCVDPQGRREGVSFKPTPGAHELTLPCGQCIGCRNDRAEQWATRVVHEAQLHEHSCFVTLTYSDEHLPPDGGLRYPDYQRFMKRLRKRFGAVRFYMCGEYGERFKRPHYHAALFGLQFPDLVPQGRTPSGAIDYDSKILRDLWQLGRVSVGELNRDSAAYIARYVVKKITGPQAQTHYRRVDPDTGESFQVQPEFTRMSLKPGIGAKWLDKYHTDVYPTDRINSQGKLHKPPRFYDKRMEVINPDILTPVRVARYNQAQSSSADNTSARLTTKEAVAIARHKHYKRSLE